MENKKGKQNFIFKFFDLILERRDGVIYTAKHKLAFLRLEKKTLGYVTWRGIIHDWDKLIFRYWMLWKTDQQIQSAHRKFSPHHVGYPRKQSQKDFREMFFDWECAPETKPDKPLRAFATMIAFYPQLEEQVMPLIIRYGFLNKETFQQAIDYHHISRAAAIALVTKYGWKAI